MMAGKKTQCLNTLSSIHKKKTEDQNKIRVSHLQELKKCVNIIGTAITKITFTVSYFKYLYCFLFQRVVRNEATTNQILSEVRIVMHSEST
jgi:nickel-dependent lactate racemase